MPADTRELVYTPRARRDLLRMEGRFARQVVEDLPILRNPPWPPGKVKHLRRVGLWEMKSGDFRVLFLPVGGRVVVARVINRRDLFVALAHVDERELERRFGERNNG